jgi:glucokinase
MREKPHIDSNMAWIGVDIDGTKTAVVLSSEPPVIIARTEFLTLPEQDPERALKLIQKGIHDLLHAQSFDKDQIAAIGVSCGGPLDRISGTIQALRTCPHCVPIASILQREFGCACRLENYANAGAVAEHRFGAGQGTQHMVFLTMGAGLGAVSSSTADCITGVGFCRRNWTRQAYPFCPGGIP